MNVTLKTPRYPLWIRISGSIQIGGV